MISIKCLAQVVAALKQGLAIALFLALNSSVLAANGIPELETAIDAWWDSKPGATAVVVRFKDRVVYEKYKPRQKLKI